MITLSEYAAMSDSELEAIVSRDRNTRSKWGKIAGYVTLAATTLLGTAAGAQAKPTPGNTTKPKTAHTQDAAKKPLQSKYIIPKIDLTVICENKEDKTYKGLQEKATIEVNYGCDIILDSPKAVKDTTGKNPLETDFLVRNTNTKEKLRNNYQQLEGKSDLAHPQTLSTEAAGMTEGQYTVFVAVEKDAKRTLASTPIYVNVTAPADAKKASPDAAVQKAAEQLRERKKAQKQKGNDEPRASVNAGAFMGELRFTPVANPDPEDKSSGFTLGAEYETRDWEIFGAVSWEQFRKKDPYMSDALQQAVTGYHAGAHAKKGSIMAGIEVAGGESGPQRTFDHMMGGYGLPKDSTVAYEGRLGLSFGNFNDEASFQAFLRYGRETRENAIADPRYGDLVTDSVTSTVKGIGLVARINDSLRASFYKTKTEHELLETDTTQVSVEVSKGFGEDKNIRPYARFSHLRKNEQGPEASVVKLQYNRPEIGLRYNWGRRR